MPLPALPKLPKVNFKDIPGNKASGSSPFANKEKFPLLSGFLNKFQPKEKKVSQFKEEPKEH